MSISFITAIKVQTPPAHYLRQGGFPLGTALQGAPAASALPPTRGVSIGNSFARSSSCLCTTSNKGGFRWEQPCRELRPPLHYLRQGVFPLGTALQELRPPLHYLRQGGFPLGTALHVAPAASALPPTRGVSVGNSFARSSGRFCTTSDKGGFIGNSFARSSGCFCTTSDKGGGFIGNSFS